MSTARKLAYAPLPWDTHPIDLAFGPQGWGPFAGPYTPLDFRDVAGSIGISGISNGYNLNAFNSADHGPGYHDITLFHDPSLDRVNAVLSKLSGAPGKTPGATYSNTISNGWENAQAQSKTTRGATLLASLKSSLLGGE